MSQFSLDDERNTASQEFSLRDILEEYWEQAVEEEPAAPVEKRSLSRRSMEALRASEEPEDGVRIYEPRRDRSEEQERLASLWGETPAPQPEEEPEEESPVEEPVEEPRPSFLEMAGGLLDRFRRNGKSSRSARHEPARELPSFDELLWGRKEEPVRILEEEEPAPVQETSAPAPEPLPVREASLPVRKEPEIEVHIPEEELTGLSVNAILSEYWGGLEEEPAAVPARPLPRRSRRQAETADVSEEAAPPVSRRASRPVSREKAKEFKELLHFRRGQSSEASAPQPRPERPAPVPVREEPVPAVVVSLKEEILPSSEEESSSSRPSSPLSAEEEALNMSVSDILSEFWAGYSEPEEQPAPPADAPRSRREASRMREEDPSLPPTDAASSAASRKASSRPRRQKSRERAVSRPEKRAEPEGEEDSPSHRAARKTRRREQSVPPVLTVEEPVRPEPESEPPAPLDPAEASSLFGFLRRPREEPVPVPEESAPAPIRRESSPAHAALEPDAPREAPAEKPSRRERRKESSAVPGKIIDEDVDYGAMSVDEILAEYNDIFAAIPAAASAIGAEREAEADKGAEPPVRKESAVPAPPAPARRGGKVSRMEEEARGILEQMRSESLPAVPEETRPRGGLRHAKPETPAAPEAPDNSLPESMPNLSGTDWSESLRRLLGQDPAPPQPSAAVEPSSEKAPELTPRRPSRGAVIPSDEVDPRFNLSGERKSSMVFGDKELDLSADESYVPPKASEKVGFHWVAGEEELSEKPLEKKSFFRKPKKEAPLPEETEHSEAYDDRRRPEYAPDKDYDEEEGGEDPNAFPSFGQYLSGLVSGLLVRLFGAKRSAGAETGTMEDEREDLGPEVSPAAASKYYGSFVTSLRMRVRIGLVLLAVLAWISFGLPVSGALRSVQVASGMALAIQLTILLLGLDVVTGSLVNLARGRFGADSLAVLSCILTSLDALSVCLGFMGTPHMPLCLISSFSFLGVLISSLVSARGLRKALRVPAIGKRCYGVSAEPAVKGSGLTLLKSMRPPKGFVRRTEEAAPDESAFLRVAPLLAILCLVFTLIVALAKHAFRESLYILTVLLSPSVPLMALLCFALPFLFGSLRIFHSGAAIAGWSGISDIGRSDNLIVTDRDLFPEGSVEIDTVRIFAEVQPETIISYAGTLICASGSDLAPCFSQLMERNSCPMRRVEGFEFLSGGGMKGVVDGSVVLCGGLDLMRLMNVRVPYRLVSKTTVLLAVDGILCGIFNMKYEGQPQVRKALVGLIRSNRHPIFAIRDFLVTPDMLSDCFEVATDGYDFPPYVDRFAISEAKPSSDSKLAAVVCREGLGPLVHMADTGRSMYLAIRINLLLTVLAAVLGVILVFAKLLSAGVVSSGFLFLFLLLWALPVVLISAFLRL